MQPVTLATLILGIILSFVWLLYVRKNLNIKWVAALILATLHISIGGLCTKIFSMIEFGSLEAFSGWRLYGATFFLPILYYIGSKLFHRSLADIADVFSVSVFIALFAFRISCIVNGCCAAKEIPFWPGVAWPIREMEMLLYVVLGVIYAPKIARRETHGEVYPIYMIVYGAFRFIVEFTREEYVTAFGIVHMAHIWSVLCFVLGASVLFSMKAMEMKKSKKMKSRR